MNSAKIPKKASEVVTLESSPKKDRTLPNSSIALCWRSAKDWMTGRALPKKASRKKAKDKLDAVNVSLGCDFKKRANDSEPGSLQP